MKATWFLVGLGMSLYWELRSPAMVLWSLKRFSWSDVRGVMAEMEEFLCLCLVLRRDVRFSSSGFMSGGSFEIFLKTRAKYMSKHADSRWRPAVTIAVSQVVIRTLSVSSSVGNIVRHRPIVVASMSALRRASKIVKT